MNKPLINYTEPPPPTPAPTGPHPPLEYSPLIAQPTPQPVEDITASRRERRAARKAQRQNANTHDQPTPLGDNTHNNAHARKRRKPTPPRHKRLPGGELRDISKAPDAVDDRPKKKLIQRSVRPMLNLPMHRATTAHASSIYPFGVHETLGHNGAYMGEDGLGGGGAFFFDAFEALTQFAESDGVTNPNMMIFGNPGMGKSALLKTMLLRSVAIYGKDRFVAIVDVKGEYTPLAEVLDLPVVKLSPGGLVRVNPLEVRGRDEERVMRQSEMIRALAEATLERRLTQIEDVYLWESLQHLDAERTGKTATLSDLVQQLRNPTEHVLDQIKLPRDTILTETSDATHAIASLLERQFRGMFDGESTVDIDPDGPGVVIDISDVQGDERALPLVMVAAITWLRELLTAGTGKKLQVLDEAWRMLAYESAARYLQSCWKLGRQMGIANIAAFHRPSNLGSQSDDGTATAKIAHSLIGDTAILISFNQSYDDIVPYADLMGWNDTQADTIVGLGRGQSLWRIGKRSVHLNHRLSTNGLEPDLCDTNAAMR